MSNIFVSISAIGRIPVGDDMLPNWNRLTIHRLTCRFFPGIGTVLAIWKR